MTAIHPAPREFNEQQLADDPILHYFHYAHLPAALQGASAPFCDLANMIVSSLPRNAERSVALCKLLEAKDAAVRANAGPPILRERVASAGSISGGTGRPGHNIPADRDGTGFDESELIEEGRTTARITGHDAAESAPEFKG
jgi:hypothetical protein